LQRISWSEHALNIAWAASKRSEDLHLKVGSCVLRADMSVASVGYNGAPSGVELDWTDRDERRKYVLHSEVNALRYVTVTDVSGGLIAVTHMPCAECLKHIVAHGIKTVVYENTLDPAVYDESAITAVALALGVTMTQVRRENAV
jgi:dCMP deaminase